MKKYFTLLLLIGIANGSGSSPYLSPGLQLGFNTKGKFFISVQTTFGYVSNSGPPPFGLTLGLRWYKMEEKWERYSYNDLQIWPFIGGVGIGQMRDKDGNKYLRRQEAPQTYQPAGLVSALTRKLLFSSLKQ